MSKILMLLKTTGLEYDDRVRKEAESLISLGHDVIIVTVVNNNKQLKGKTYYNVYFQTVKLISRYILKYLKCILNFCFIFSSIGLKLFGYII